MVVEELAVQEEEVSNVIEEQPAIDDSDMLSTLDENLFVSDEELYVEPATEKIIVLSKPISIPSTICFCSEVNSKFNVFYLTT